jgi:hypothetical protein
MKIYLYKLSYPKINLLVCQNIFKPPKPSNLNSDSNSNKNLMAKIITGPNNPFGFLLLGYGSGINQNQHHFQVVVGAGHKSNTKRPCWAENKPNQTPPDVQKNKQTNCTLFGVCSK